MEGKYYTERGNTAEMFWQNGKLRGRNSNSGSVFDVKMSEEGKGRYRIVDAGILVLDEKNKSADSVMQFTMENPTNTFVYRRQPAVPQKITAEFGGRYFSEETEAYYSITEKNGQLTLEHRKFASVSLKNIAPDQFTAPHWWMSHLRWPGVATDPVNHLYDK